MPAGQELDATVEALTGLLPGLTGQQARQALSAAISGNGAGKFHAARYWSLRRFLAARPEVLSSGTLVTASDLPRLVAPQDVKRLTAELSLLGRGDMVIPAQRCTAGRHLVRDGCPPNQGCGRCDAETALADCAGLIAARLDEMPAAVARSCLLAAIDAGKSRNAAFRLRTIAAWLRERPDALGTGPTGCVSAPPVTKPESRRRTVIGAGGPRACASATRAAVRFARHAGGPIWRHGIAAMLAAARHGYRSPPGAGGSGPAATCTRTSAARSAGWAARSASTRPGRPPAPAARPCPGPRAAPAGWTRPRPGQARARCACGAAPASPARAAYAGHRPSAAPLTARPAARRATRGSRGPAAGAAGCA